MFCTTMLSLSPLVMLPLTAAFLISIVLSFRYDQVSFRNGPHLALACLAMAAMVSYVVLAVGHWLPYYADAAFAGLGLLLLSSVLVEVADNWRFA
jgi:CHASE2 domain-containing sensor protein